MAWQTVRANDLADAAVLAAGDTFVINRGNVLMELSANPLVLAAGSATVAPLKFVAGTNLTTPEVGAAEFDGTAFYDTADTTNGRAQRTSHHIFRLTADGSAIGPTIADFFGANSALPTVTNGIYEICFYLWFLKTTAGTVTPTLTNTQTYANLVATWEGSALAGITPRGAQNIAAITGATAAASALPVTGSLADAADHWMKVSCLAVCGTAGNIRLQFTSSAGTVTPRRGSYYTARRLFAGNVGTFVA